MISAVGSLQVCGEQEAGCQSLIHAMRTVYEDHLSVTVLMMVVSTEFSSINRNAFLHSIRIMCPPLPIVAIVIMLILDYLLLVGVEFNQWK